jgi:hypothetical protein
LYFGIDNWGGKRVSTLRVHSLHVSDEISLQIALECASFSGASVLIGIVDASMLCKLVARVEGFLANVAVE